MEPRRPLRCDRADVRDPRLRHAVFRRADAALRHGAASSRPRRALVAAGLLATTLVTQRWHILLSIGLLLGLAAGMLGLSLAATIGSRWFVARRGLVVGILTAAFAAGQLSFVPLAAWLSTTYGWRAAVIPAFVGGAVCAVLFLLLGRDSPSELGLPPYGEKQVAPPQAASAAGAIALALASLREAAATPVFWALAGSFFVCGLSSTGIVQQHFIPFCADNSIGAVTAASYLALMGLFNFIGTIASGWLSDRFDNRAAARALLRPARRLADLSAVQRFQRAGADPVGGVLRARLRRDGAADGAHHRPELRHDQGPGGVRLAVRRPPARRRRRGLRLGPDPRLGADLHARVPGGRHRLLRRRGPGRLDPRAPASAGGGVSTFAEMDVRLAP